MVRMGEETSKKHTGKCFDCEGSLELVEFDLQKDYKIMKCLNCGLLHQYKKDLLGRWKLLKVTKHIGDEDSTQAVGC
jgi:hypothetical protein